MTHRSPLVCEEFSTANWAALASPPTWPPCTASPPHSARRLSAPSSNTAEPSVTKCQPILNILAEGFGATKFSGQSGTNSLEADLAAQIIPLNSKFSFLVGGGLGVLEGVGVPKFRAFGGLMFNNEAADQDGDGIADSRD